MPDGATLSQLSEASATPKSSLLALLRALTQSGFLQLRGGRYVIGRLWRMSDHHTYSTGQGQLTFGVLYVR